MRLPRFSLRASMVAVALLASTTWWLTETYVKAPARKHLSRLTGYHEIRQGGWSWIAEGYDDIPENQSTIAECRRIAEWHARRLRELHSMDIPTADTWWEEGQRMNEYEFNYQATLGASGFVRVDYRSFR